LYFVTLNFLRHHQSWNGSRRGAENAEVEK